MRALTLCASAVLSSVFVAALPAQDLKIVGSTTVRPVVEKMAREYKKVDPAIKIDVQGGGSSAGVKGAGEGQADLGMSSREVKKAEQEKYKDLGRFQIGIDGIAVVVHKNNPAKQITKQQLADVFLGKITNWKEIGGPDAPIKAVCCMTSHGTFDAFAEFLGIEGEQAADGKTVALRLKSNEKGAPTSLPAADGNKALIGSVISDPNVIVCASAGAAASNQEKGAPVKALDLEGTAPTEANIASGKYAFQRPLFLLTKGQPNPAQKAFLDFALSAKGQEIVKSLDLLPAPAVSASPAK